MTRKAMLIDTTLCMGASCNQCQDACLEANGLPELPEDKKGRLSDMAWTAIKEVQVEDVGEINVRQLCRHCHDPICLSVCLVSAFHKTPDGAVLYDVGKCIGCRYCMQACPFHVPTYNWQSLYPKVIKCVLCSRGRKGEDGTMIPDRLSQGLEPACAEACPVGATVFGDYDEIIAEARNRMDENPEGYVPKIYGLTEAGGTTVLYLSSVPFEQLGFDTALQEEPLPNLTWAALNKVPYVVGVGSALLGGIWWITNRREEVRQHELHEAENHGDHGSER